ncbi:MAG: IPT/TIG domain-containing protein [Bacteroidetes bacterium]|nr:IPT/TIG domain-containing protein [Bacteroidota bacterium]
MNSLMRMCTALFLLLAVVGCNEHDDAMNPAAADDAAMHKKPSTPTPSGPVITSVTLVPNPSLNPSSRTEIGEEIIIEGQDFGPRYKYATNYVTICGVQAGVYALWSKTKIQVTIPSGSLTPTGAVTVTVNGVVSNEVVFTIQPSTPVTIGNQTWAGANLDVTTYRNNDPIPQITDTATWASATYGAWCWYNFDPDMGARFGKLYNWHAVNDSRGLAPAGQHIPSDAEWTELAVTLGASSSEASQAIGYFGIDEGGKLKEVGYSTWSGPNEGATNSSGFTALPGGFIGYTGNIWGFMFYGDHVYGLCTVYWTQTEAVADPTQAWYRWLHKDEAHILRNFAKKGCGFSVRTIYDN